MKTNHKHLKAFRDVQLQEVIDAILSSLPQADKYRSFFTLSEGLIFCGPIWDRNNKLLVPESYLDREWFSSELLFRNEPDWQTPINLTDFDIDSFVDRLRAIDAEMGVAPEEDSDERK